jgi:hypothetical protein
MSKPKPAKSSSHQKVASKKEAPKSAPSKKPAKRLTVDDLENVKAGAECTFGNKSGCTT